MRATTETNSADAEPKWLALARVEIGVHEGAGDDDNPVVLQYYADAGHPEIEHDETAWCAAFACAMLERAGFHSPKNLAARSFLQWGKESGPVKGAITVLKRGDSTWQGHVGFLVSWTDDTVTLLGGNQSDQVKMAVFPRSKVLGFRVPVTASNSRTIAAAHTTVVSGATSALAQSVAAAVPAPETLAQMADAGNAFAGTLSGLSSVLPVLGVVAGIISVVAGFVVFYARMDDLAKKGR